MKIHNKFFGIGMLFLLTALLHPIVGLCAGEPEKKIPIKGEWDVVYMDKNLGPVKGTALVSEDETSAKVEYIHPKTGEKFQMTSTSFNREGNKVIINLQGKMPSSGREDGQGYPERDLLVPEDTRKVTVSVGKNEVRTIINTRKGSDVNKVKLLLGLGTEDSLYGFWSYKSDPVIQRETRDRRLLLTLQPAVSPAPLQLRSGCTP